jgi:hypothetical protein
MRPVADGKKTFPVVARFHLLPPAVTFKELIRRWQVAHSKAKSPGSIRR